MVSGDDLARSPRALRAWRLFGGRTTRRARGGPQAEPGLRAWSDRDLRDLGLTREDVVRALSSPFD
ncbi:MAG: DUF1127 domain-containing protein [Pseudomonadota bacterium]